MSVKVGVRVRPFNKRQQQLECRRCIEMEGATTRLIDNDHNVKNFVYDYSFWSHDKFMVDPDGIFIPVDDKYADQRKVYEEIGSDILLNAWQGYNCCLFAYGQTGSGKSYSMIGYGANKGVIPIVCDQIFKKIQKNTDSKKSFEVMVSMMEIYNEAVRDLLQKNKKTQIKICESKKLGVYVDGLYKHPVHSYQEIAQKIEEGSNNRSIAATLMNESSSRSHTIVSINFVQKIQVSASNTSIKYSTIHLVDLAGSECVAKTGVNSKDRLRETAKINQSLSTLGRVIEILAENSGKVDKQFVPYRDSKLTFILRNALGGNSRTAMICAVSPADDNYEETLSTLRYASRAKKIQNSAIVNESDVDKLIRMLREENEMLKKMLQEAKFTKTVINQEVIENYNRMSQNMVDFGIVDEREDDSLLGNLEEQQASQFGRQGSEHSRNSPQSYISSNKLLSQTETEKLKLPYITNVSEDQLLSFRVKYSCQDLIIGNKDGSPRPDVVLAALGIQPNHARIYIDGEHEGVKRVYMELLSEESQEYTYLNGQNLRFGNRTELSDFDRIIFGTGCIFLVVVAGGMQKSTKPLSIEDIDYQFALKEMQSLTLDKSKIFEVEEENIRKKIVSEVQSQYQQTKRQNELKLKQQIEAREQEYQKKLKQLELRKNEETSTIKGELEKKQALTLELEKEKREAQEEIEKYRQLQKQIQEQIVDENSSHNSGEAHSDPEQQREQQLEKMNKALLQKQDLIEALKVKIGAIKDEQILKQSLAEQRLQMQEVQVQRELEMKTIMCENENVISEYRLELSKKIRNAKEARDLLIKKEKAFLQKQLIELVPMVEKFNLMAREMGRRVEAGLSVQFRYISEVEAIEALKNNSYKSKLKILIHVANKEELRSYYWSCDVFRNRFEHAIDHFENFISYAHSQRESSPGDAKNRYTIDRVRDPYWDPDTFKVLGYAFVSLQCLLYQFQFSGQLAIVSHGKQIGSLQLKANPSKNLLQQSISSSVRTNSAEEGIKIYNPRDLIERSLSFSIDILGLALEISPFNIVKLKVEYELLESNYKMKKYQSPEIDIGDLERFTYSRSHVISDISENTLLHYSDRPVMLTVLAMTRLSEEDELTNRESFLSSKISSFVGSAGQEQLSQDRNEDSHGAFKDLEQITISKFEEVPRPSAKKVQPPTCSIGRTARKSGVIVQNSEIMSKIQSDYNRKRRQSEQTDSAENPTVDRRRKKKKDQCKIY